MTHRIPVFFRPEQSSDVATGFSPSAGKPAKVVTDWLSRRDIADYIEVQSFEPATDGDLCLAHDPSYVEGVLSCELENGFGNKRPEIAESLKYTTGSLIAACRYVLTSPDQRDLMVAASPTSGFHHAGYDFGGGFCTFNGLMVAAIRIHMLGLANRILILDLDAHFGNGTEHIIKTLGIDYVTNLTADKSYKTANEALLVAESIYRKGGYDLVIFQAGGDLWKEDPLGCGLLTISQMKSRDSIVFLGCAARQIPVVFTLAGGYATDKAGTIEPVLALHRQTMGVCIQQFKK